LQPAGAVKTLFSATRRLKPVHQRSLNQYRYGLSDFQSRTLSQVGNLIRDNSLAPGHNPIASKENDEASAEEKAH
ncbi:MAG: hypothetical protein Q8M16_17520, partial [Pirellulaceae bacterium]|nr:hypothetical protein [Pirellulaceae bacterium]